MGPCTETLGPSYMEALEGHTLGKPSACAGEPFLLCCQATMQSGVTLPASSLREVRAGFWLRYGTRGYVILDGGIRCLSGLTATAK